jgi:hypothetical protein
MTNTVIKFDKTNLKNIRADINTALAAVESKYGIKLDIGNISFDSSTFNTKLSAVTTSVSAESGNVEVVDAKWKRDFDRNCVYLGFSKEDFGKECKVGNRTETYTIVGALARKSNLILKTPVGRFISVPADKVSILK